MDGADRINSDNLNEYKPNCCFLEVGHADKDNNFSRNIYIRRNQFNKYRQKYDNVGIFTSAYAYDIEDPDEAFLLGNLYLDLDDLKDFSNIQRDALVAVSFLENICGIKREFIRIYFSGKKGIHITVSHIVFGIEPTKNLNAIFKAIAVDLKMMSSFKTVDTKIYDKRRLFRTPLSIHQQTNLYKIPLTMEELQKMAHDDILTLAEKPREINYPKPKFIQQANNIYLDYEKKINKSRQPDKLGGSVVLTWSPPCVKKLYRMETGKGERNNTCAILASHFRCRQFDLDKIMELLLDWNSKKCSPMMSEKEIEKTVKSLYVSEKTYGCSTLRAMELCDRNCKYNK